jgi:hypothetical protein
MFTVLLHVEQNLFYEMSIKKLNIGQALGLTLVNLATPEAKIGRIAIPGQPWAKFIQIPYQQISQA